MTTLVIAPHADDETLAMGGTIAKKRAAGEDVVIAVMTGHGDHDHPLWPRETWDIIRAEAHEAMTALGNPTLRFFELPASCLSETPIHRINDTVARLIADVAPCELYLPYLHDLHRDHGALAYAALVASRAYLQSARTLELVAMYETPTETHLMPSALAPAFSPNHYEVIDGYVDDKLAAWDCYRSQHQSGYAPRTVEALRALATWRGAEVGAAAAEGFVLVRRVVRPTSAVPA